MDQSDCEDLVTEDQDEDFETPKVSVSAPPAPWRKRLIILLDVDSFEFQLWTKLLCPELLFQDVPIVVVNPQKIILSVNYTARSFGVKRGEGPQALVNARSQCSKAGVKLFEITAGERFGKVDSFRPQTESDLILDSILEYIEMIRPNGNLATVPIIVERSCKDEVYIDVTQLIDDSNTDYYKMADPLATPTLSQEPTLELIRLKKHPNRKYNGIPTTIMEGLEGIITGQDFIYRVLKEYPDGREAHYVDERRLVQGAIHANGLIQHIKKKTGYDVSAGVSHNKLVAKLACGRNKPKGITIITQVSLFRLSKSILFQDLPGYAGPTGQRIRDLLFSERKQDVKSIDDLLRAVNSDFKNLVPVFKKLNIPVWKSIQLQNLCQFKDDSLVIPRVYNDTFGTSLSFKGLTGQLDLFQEGVMNLSMDMLSRIAYYRTRGRHAQELCIKGEMIKNSRVSPGGRANKISISEGDDLTAIDLKEKILVYIDENNLNRNEIFKIKLTASNIKVHKPCPNERLMSEAHFSIDAAEQGRTGHKEFREIRGAPPAIFYTSRTWELGARLPTTTVGPLFVQPIQCNFLRPRISQSAPDIQDEENNVGFTMDDVLVFVLIILVLAMTFSVFHFGGSESFFMLNDD